MSQAAVREGLLWVNSRHITSDRSTGGYVNHRSRSWAARRKLVLKRLCSRKAAIQSGFWRTSALGHERTLASLRQEFSQFYAGSNRGRAMWIICRSRLSHFRWLP